MPKVTLNYEFDSITDQTDLQTQLNAGKLYCAALEMSDWLRAKDKYSEVNEIMIEDVRKQFHEFFEGLIP